ncbi:hypothetical protein [Chryseobacterium sp. BLS98]|uniref:hypothetical protein n=1 Tax=Chryseobacterium sp. BLS98 TaxID=885586 RepID=UPI0013F44E4B|nr:hypothetical protein [Chryseobacterium sp. BLS98]
MTDCTVYIPIMAIRHYHTKSLNHFTKFAEKRMPADHNTSERFYGLTIYGL